MRQLGIGIVIVSLAACAPREEGAGGASAAVIADSGAAGDTVGGPPSASVDTASAPAGATTAPAPSRTPPPTPAAPDTGHTLLRAVRVAKQDGFERIVFEFSGRLPKHRVQFEATPARCGSGDPVTPVGGTALVATFDGADAHRFDGERAIVTVPDRDRRPGLPLVKQLTQICDFEAQVQWLIGLESRRRFEVSTLASPARVVVDVY
jgi:hypothetical protein